MIPTLLALAVAVAPPQVPLRPGMVITHSITVKRATYRFPAPLSTSTPP